MPKRPRLSKDGKPREVGTRLPRKRQFDPVLETRSGIKVRSQYEQECVAWFEANGIEFQYEPVMLIGGRQYRPDFFLPKYNLFVEICGYGHMPHYTERQKKKEAAYKKAGLKSVFIYCREKGEVVRELKAAFRDQSNGPIE
jgi:hypothetical protein